MHYLFAMAIEVPSSIVQSGNTAADHQNGNGHTHAVVLESSKLSSAAAAIPSSQFLSILGLFVFYIGHDALQEEMFRFNGYEYGFFMTLVEVLVMLIGSILSEGNKEMCISFLKSSKSKQKRKQLSAAVLIRIGWVGLLLALAHGLGNTSLNYSPYPLKVAFKSCKLVPTMALGAFVTGRKHTALQYTAALVMGMGLACLTAADVFNSKQSIPLDHSQHNPAWKEELGPFIGPILLTISTVFDSIVPNLQEQLLQKHRVKTSEMILVSNIVMCFVLLAWTVYSGELIFATTYCIQHRDASLILLLQGLCAYLGLKCYLSIIRDYGGVIAVLITNARKVLTISLSFMLFKKAFNERHFIGLILVFVGVYLGYISKKGHKKKIDNGESLSSPNRRKQSPLKKSESDNV